MNEILEIMDFGVAVAVMIVVFSVVSGKIRFSRLSFYMLIIGIFDMIVDGLQGEIVSFIISSLVCLFWISIYRRDRRTPIKP